MATAVPATAPAPDALPLRPRAPARSPMAWLSTVIVGACGVFLLAPLLNLLVWAFSQSWFFPAALPTVWTLKWFGYVFAQAHLTQAIIYSLTLAPTVTLVSALICWPAAYAIGRAQFPGRRFVTVFILAANAFPQFGIYISLATLMYALNLIATFPGVVIVQLLGTLVTMTWIPAAAFASVPVTLEEAARDSGAGPFRTFLRVTLPLAMPGLLTALVLAFLAAFDESQGTLLIGVPNIVTMPVMMYSLVTGYSEPVAAVFSILLAIPSLALLLLIRRHLVQGALASGFTLI